MSVRKSVGECASECESVREWVSECKNVPVSARVCQCVRECESVQGRYYGEKRAKGRQISLQLFWNSRLLEREFECEKRNGEMTAWPDVAIKVALIWQKVAQNVVIVVFTYQKGGKNGPKSQ